VALDGRDDSHSDHTVYFLSVAAVKSDLSMSATQQIVAGERGIALFSTGLVRRGLRVTARAT
jgi:hypothetical protein